MIRVLLADDQEMVRAGLAMILDTAEGMEVVAAVADGRAAVEAARETRPDVCLLDVRMPVLDGVGACAEIVADSTIDPAVVMVTTFDDDAIVDAALDAGAVGFLLKTASAALVVEAVSAAAAGDQLIAPEITGRLLRRLAAGAATGSGARAEASEPIDALSPREEEVLVLVAAGSTNAEIADRLHVSVATVKTHVNSLLNKLVARNRVELAAFAFRTGRVS